VVRRVLNISAVAIAALVSACTDAGGLGDTEATTGLLTTTSGDTLDTTSTTTPISASASETDPSDGSSGGGTCGDGTREGSEACDGTDLGGASCLTEGFDGGSVSCLADCTLDTSACTMCGDGTIDVTEDCEGSDLDGATCESIGGFGGGTLACQSDCRFDTSQCDLCGNDLLDDGEDCDGEDFGGTTCADLAMGFTGGTLVCDACSLVTTGCTSFPNPDAAGQVVITEIMQNPQTVADADGEYFEIHNPSTTETYQLQGCSIAGNQSDTGFDIVSDLEVAPDAYVTLAVQSDQDPGFIPDLEWSPGDFSLNNGSDRVAVMCGATLIDEVSYDDGVTFPDPNGASMNLDPDAFDATLNDAGGQWCEAQTDFNGDAGSPGAANEQCPIPTTYDIDFCRLQFPTTIEAVASTTVDVFGRVYSAGLTDVDMTGNDVVPEVVGYVGYGPDGTDPSVDQTWVWTAGTPNAGYDTMSPNFEPNNDEYMATLTVPAPGVYDFAFRFTGDSGVSFTYCDGQAEGSSNGYAPADAGQMAALQPPLYFSEYVEGAGSDKALEIYNASATDAYDLSQCTVRFYFNGATTAGANIALTTTLAADSTYVLCDDGLSDTTNCDQTNAGSFYNGNDAVELFCGGMTLDVIGQIGNDPGTEWSNAGVGTADEVLRRDCMVTVGDANGADAFDPSVEWASFAANDFTDLGQYVCP
jgi:hypothetical protein